MNLNSIKPDLCTYWIYDRYSFEYLHNGICEKPDIEIDYLTKLETELVVKDEHTMYQYLNNFIVIKFGRDEIFFGVITSYTDIYNLQLTNFLDYIDYPCFVWHGRRHEPCELLSDLISNEYVSGDDIKQIIPNLTVTFDASSHSVKYKDDTNTTYNLQEVRKELFNKYNIIAKVTFSHNDKTVNIHVSENTNGIRSISTKLHDVIEVTNIDFSMVTNKVRLYNKWTTTDETTNESITHIVLVDDYYLLNDGSITTDPTDTNRLEPVVMEIVYCDQGEEDDSVSNTLTAWQYQEELELKVLTESKMIIVEEYGIGDPLKIHYGNYVTVTTKISGMYLDGLYTVFKCGINRNTLENYLRKNRR